MDMQQTLFPKRLAREAWLLAIYWLKYPTYYLSMNYKFYRILLIVYALIILMISATPSSDLPKMWLLQYDKIIHFVEYLIFGVLAMKSMTTQSMKVGLILIPFGIMFGFFDEYLQSFISGRYSSLMDVFSDSIGFSIWIILVYLTQNDR